MPRLGLGTWPMVGDEARAAVLHALSVGYRLIDTSEQYANEEAVGAALRAGGIPREEVFITSKFNARWHGFDLVRQACEASLQRLGVDYLDLYLVHWPNPWLDRYADAWKGLIALREAGAVRAIGTSNFLPAHIDRLLAETGVAPEVNQIELDPTLPQASGARTTSATGSSRRHGARSGAAVSSCATRSCASWPRGTGSRPRRSSCAGMSSTRSCPPPRSSNPGRITENLDVFDFRLASDELESMRMLDRGRAPERDPESHGH